MGKLKIVLAAVAVSMAGGAAAPALAAGCNGVVNIFKWGCAPWDNNNGPQHPYYVKKTVGIAPGTPVKCERGACLAYVNGAWVPVVLPSGAQLVGNDGASLVAAGGGNLVAAGGGNLRGLISN